MRLPFQGYVKVAEKKHIFFADDEPDILEAVSETLTELGVKVSCFSNAADCLRQLTMQDCDLLITDVNMPTMDGMTLLAKAKKIRPLLPILVVTGYGDIPLAVQAVKQGAIDFIEKPLTEKTLLSAVKPVLERENSSPLVGKLLSKREREILKLVLEGKNNSEISYLLHRTVKTVETHRYRMMRKLDVHNLAELINISSRSITNTAQENEIVMTKTSL